MSAIGEKLWGNQNVPSHYFRLTDRWLLRRNILGLRLFETAVRFADGCLVPFSHARTRAAARLLKTAHSFHRIFFTLCLVVGCINARGEAPAGDPYRVVILNSANFFLRSSFIQGQAIRDVFANGSNRRFEFYPEALETFRLPSAEFEPEYVAFLKKKYANIKVNVVLAESLYALEFAERHRDALWPGTPVVFYCVSERLVQNRKLPSGFTGQALGFDVNGTIDLALRLQPQAKQVVVAGGMAETDQYWVARATKRLHALDGKIGTLYLTNQSVPQMMATVHGLGRDSIVLWTSLLRDNTGQSYASLDVMRSLVKASGAPVYYPFATNGIGEGVIGGSLASYEAQGEGAARIALRILAGEKPEAIPVQPPLPFIVMVDWRQLQRWGISEGLLPPNSAIEFRVPSFWELYHSHIVISGGVIASQALLILTLLVQRRQRFLAETQVQLDQAELAHAARLATVGELTASIAHELNQPLGAILRNAEAAEVILQTASPDLEEIRAIVTDIRTDDHRASNVIDRLRALLKRHKLETQLLNVGKLIEEVVALVRWEAVNRRVRLETEVPGGLPPVDGDRVHLQQVLLNLIVNGMEAINWAPDNLRCVAICARLDGAQMIEVSVSDTGQGIPQETVEDVFNPFFTTKTDGMGLGRSVSRTLVEAPGGRIWAEKNASGGATFRFTLPVAVEGKSL